MSSDWTEQVAEIEGIEIFIRFQQATNGLLLITDVEDEPLIANNGPKWH
jgi:hypothetical protein